MTSQIGLYLFVCYSTVHIVIKCKVLNKNLPYVMLALLVVQLLKIKPAVNSLNLFTIIMSVNVHLHRYGILAGSLRSRREGFTL